MHARGLLPNHETRSVIGTVVSTQKLESLEGLKLLLVQPLDEKGAEAGAAIVAFDVDQPEKETWSSSRPGR